MSGSRREVEIKLRCATPASALELLQRLGATPVVARHFEDNVVYDREHDRLRDADRLLRLRRSGDRALLTYKEPVAGRHAHKVRREDETRVDDAAALHRILDGLGFRPCYRYQKYRTEFAYAGVNLCLDETPIGCFLELEGPPESIDRAAALMGFAPPDYLKQSYRDLHEQLARSRCEEAGDLVFLPPAEDAP